MKIFFTFFTITFSTVLFSQVNGPTPAPLYSFGFEGDTKIEQNTNFFMFDSTSYEGQDEMGDYNKADIIGDDGSINWESTLENNVLLGNFDSFHFYYEGGNSSERFSGLAPDPQNPENQTLNYRISTAALGPIGGPAEKGRVQANFENYDTWDLNNGTGFEIFHYSVKMFIPVDFERLPASANFSWFTLAEFFNNPGWSTDDPNFHPFRISLDLITGGSSTDLELKLETQTKVNDIWTQCTNDCFSDTSAVTVPIGEWFTLDVFLEEGTDIPGNKEGRIRVKINSDVAFDYVGYTYHPDDPNPDGFTHIQPFKMYLGETNLETNFRYEGVIPSIYWDDFTIYDDIELTNKHIKLIDNIDACNVTLNIGNVMSLYTDAIDGVDNTGNNNWSYRFKFNKHVSTGQPAVAFYVDSFSPTIDLTGNNDIENNSIYDVRVRVNNHPYHGDYGSISANSCLVTTQNVVSFTAPENPPLKLVISPNPKGNNQNEINIAFDVIDALSNSHIYITDNDGNVIKTILDRALPKGSYQETIDVNALKNKIYLCVFENNNERVVKKMIVEQ